MALTKLTKTRSWWTTFKLKTASSITRSIYDKVVESGVSIRDFGAVGDGVTDDTIPIQLAIDSVIGLNRNVIVPAGNFIHTGITLTNRTLKGGGTLTHTGNAAGITMGNNSSVSDITILGHALADNILVDASSAVDIRKCSIKNGKNNIRVKFVTFGLNITDNIIGESASDNIFIIQAKRSFITNNYIKAASGWGINADSTEAASADQQHGVMIQDNHLFGNADGGIRIFGKIGDNTQHFMIEDNHIDHNYIDSDLDHDSWGIYAENVSKLMVNGNLIRSQTVMGCELVNVGSPIITGNTFWKSTNNPAYVNTAFKSTGSIGEWVGNHVEEAVIGIELWGEFGRTYSRSNIFRALSDIYIDVFRIQRNSSGSNEGKIFMNLDTDISKRTVTIYNGARTDTTLEVYGDVFPSNGLVLTASDGLKYRLTLASGGVPVTNLI